MADDEHFALLKEGVDAWNEWRRKNPGIVPDLRGADLQEADLDGANLSGSNLSGANLDVAYLRKTDLRGADIQRAQLDSAHLEDADLREADLRWAHLAGAHLERARLGGANLRFSNLIDADLTDADLTGASVYGVSAWKLTLVRTIQRDLIVTAFGEPEVTVDNIEVAQFVYLLLHNEKIRDVIDTVGKKGVLLLGRFTDGRLEVLNRLRARLRDLGFVPMVFNFDKPETKTFTETVRLLAGLSHFVIVDITKPRSAPLELQATVPEHMVPFVPILQLGEEPFAMFTDLWITHRAWVLDLVRYSSVDRLIEALETRIVAPAEVRFAELLVRKAEQPHILDI
jgi:hypothetical protein